MLITFLIDKNLHILDYFKLMKTSQNFSNVLLLKHKMYFFNLSSEDRFCFDTSIKVSLLYWVSWWDSPCAIPLRLFIVLSDFEDNPEHKTLQYYNFSLREESFVNTIFFLFFAHLFLPEECIRIISFSAALSIYCIIHLAWFLSHNYNITGLGWGCSTPLKNRWINMKNSVILCLFDNDLTPWIISKY